MEWTVLIAITFLAATVQSATGFGFGLIAVSAFLLLLNSVTAIQLVIIITLAMSCVHWVKLKGIAPGRLLKWLAVGCTMGFPLGILVYYQLDIEVIKAVIAVVIILTSLQSGWHLFSKSGRRSSLEERPHRQGAVMGIGVASGFMASSMAMPGPAVMLYLSRTALSKNEIRATILSYFVFAYGGALLLQTLLIGIEQKTWVTAGLLIPPALIGVVVGHLVSKIINQKLFKGLVLLILLLTGLFMLVNL